MPIIHDNQNLALRASIVRKYAVIRRFAGVMDVSPAYVSKVLHYERKLDPKIQRKWARKLGVDVAEIFPEVRGQGGNGEN